MFNGELLDVLATRFDLTQIAQMELSELRNAPESELTADEANWISSSAFENVTLFLIELFLLFLFCSVMWEKREMIRPGSEASFYSISVGYLESNKTSANSFKKKLLAV
jgi:hypothetical protein